MSNAELVFTRKQGVVEMTLSVQGKVVASSASEESIVRELQIHGIRFLSVDGVFSTDLPTSSRTLKAASEVDFKELMPALKLIAACSAMGEVAAFPFPERRARPRAVMPTTDDQRDAQQEV